jgi:hypothetical protein
VNPKIIAAAVILAIAVMAGCTGNPPNAQQLEQQQQTQDTQSLVNNMPIPHFNYSQERAALIAAERISANGTQTTSFFFNQGVRDPIFICPSIGMAIPDSAQLSNPTQIAPITSRWGGGATTLEQMDPFGVYTPSASTGTYVICVNAQGQEYLRRWEGFVDTITAPATWNSTTHTEQLTGAPTAQIKTRKTS